MARLSRITVPDIPHHVTQRGNRRLRLFEVPDDYTLYLDLMAERCRANSVACWNYGITGTELRGQDTQSPNMAWSASNRELRILSP